MRAKGTPFGAIIVRDSIREPGRKNFTVAHEIGHCVLPGHDKADLVCTSTEVGNWSDSAKEFEREANEFAAELLMPEVVVRQIMGRTSHGADADAARTRALAAYQDFLTLWKDADPDIFILKEAKAEYANLQ